MEKYVKESTIGKGTFGAVYLARNRENKKLYALKEVPLDERCKHRTKESVLSEAKILATLRHPNIVAYHDSFFDKHEERLFIIQDYCDGGTLEDKILGAAERKESLEEKQIMQWFIQLCMAVHYIHSQKILHRDLKTQNVFMKKKGNICKIGDFGIAKRMTATLDRASTFIGTPHCLAPEMCQDIPYSSKADVWALGCLLYEMCALKPAYDGNNLISLIFRIVKETPKPIPEHCPQPLRDLVQLILVKNPDERPSVGQILQLPYVKSVIADFVSRNLTARNVISSPASTPNHRMEADELSSTLTHLNVAPLTDTTGQKSKAPAVDIDRTSENANAAEMVEYEDDFEPEESEKTSAADSDESAAYEYCDDFEEYTPEQEIDDLVSRANEVQQKVWSPSDDVTVVDDGPVEIRQLLKPHCEAAVGKDRFDAIVSQINAAKPGRFTRSSVSDQLCYFIEELYAVGEGDNT